MLLQFLQRKIELLDGAVAQGMNVAPPPQSQGLTGWGIQHQHISLGRLLHGVLHGVYARCFAFEYEALCSACSASSSSKALVFAASSTTFITDVMNISLSRGNRL